MRLRFWNIAKTYSVAVDEVKKMIAVEDIKADILTGKAMTFVKENAIVK